MIRSGEFADYFCFVLTIFLRLCFCWGVEPDGAILLTTPQEMSLLDVRKEVSFCRKVKMPIIGVVENMAGFVCPKCAHESVIFPPTTGGAQKMCEEMDVRLLGSLPLDPHMMQCCDTGSLPVD